MFDKKKLHEINERFGQKIRCITDSIIFHNYCKNFKKQTPEMKRIAKAIYPVAICNPPKKLFYFSISDEKFDAFDNFVPTRKFYNYIDSITDQKHQFEVRAIDILQNYTHIGKPKCGSYCTLVNTGVLHNGKHEGQLKVVIDSEKLVNNRTALAHELFHSFDERHWNLDCRLHYSDHFTSEIGAMYMEDLATDYFTDVVFKDDKELCEKLKYIKGNPHLFNNIFKARDAYLDYLVNMSIAGGKKGSIKAQEEIVNNYNVLWDSRVIEDKINQIFGFMTRQNHYDPMREARYVIGASINEQLHSQNRPLKEKIEAITTLNNNLCHLDRLNHTDETSTIDITTRHLGVDKIEKLTSSLANKINTHVQHHDKNSDLSANIDSNMRWEILKKITKSKKGRKKDYAKRIIFFMWEIFMLYRKLGT